MQNAGKAKQRDYRTLANTSPLKSTIKYNLNNKFYTFKEQERFPGNNSSRISKSTRNYHIGDHEISFK